MLGRAVVVHYELWKQREVSAQVLEPELHHGVPAENGHVLVLQVGRCVEIQSLQRWVDQSLDTEFYSHALIHRNLGKHKNIKIVAAELLAELEMVFARTV